MPVRDSGGTGRAPRGGAPAPDSPTGDARRLWMGPVENPVAPDAAVPGLVIMSNRGPVSFAPGPDGPEARRGKGGLVTALGPVVADTGATWVAAAMTPTDREVAASGAREAGGYRLRMLDIPTADYARYYDVISNGVLWFCHHALWDRARRPRFDLRFREAWDAYRRVNDAYARAAAEEAPDDGVVLVHDYHLSLVGSRLRELRPDVRTVHFHHTPFAGPDDFAVLPDDIGDELLAGLCGHGACGFNATRWAEAFVATCRERGHRPPPTFAGPPAPDAGDLERVAASDACRAAGDRIDAATGGRRLIVRVDRIELSKNLLRGFWAFDDLLERHPRWRGRVCFVASVYPSRETLAPYAAYRQEVENAVERINGRWGDGDWTPIIWDATDDFPFSVAALQRYDVLLVNPVRDGCNLVAMEGPLVNRRGGRVLLSPLAGAWERLRDAVTTVHPYDVSGTADTLAAALEAGPDPGAADRLRSIIRSRSARDWLAEQLAAAGVGTDG